MKLLMSVLAVALAVGVGGVNPASAAGALPVAPTVESGSAIATKATFSKGMRGKRMGYKSMDSKRMGYKSMGRKRMGYKGMSSKRMGYKGMGRKRMGYRGMKRSDGMMMSRKRMMNSGKSM